MDYLELYKNHLLSRKQPPSSITVKNYLADIRKFVSWYEGRYNQSFTPKAISHEIIRSFLTSFSEGNSLQPNMQTNVLLRQNSLKRYTSSLRSFFQFLEAQEIIEKIPFMQPVPQTTSDHENVLKLFKVYLSTSGIGRLTRKYYSLDIESFLHWAKRVIADVNGAPVSSVLPYITEDIIHEYKHRLLYERKLSPVSINRNLASLRKFLHWAKSQGFLPRYEEQNKIANVIKTPSTSAPILTELASELPVFSGGHDQSANLVPHDNPENATRSFQFGPWRMTKRIAKVGLRIVDISLIPLFLKGELLKEYVSWFEKGKDIFDAIPVNGFETNKEQTPSNPIHILPLPKKADSFYIPIKQAPTQVHRRVLHTIKYERPTWYRKYHSYTFTHYLHFAVLMLSISVMSYIFMNNIGIGFAEKNLAFARVRTGPPRILSYSGLLKDINGSAITTPTSVRFSIYSDQNASGSALLWQDVQQVTPDKDGQFSATIGSFAPIPDTVFTDNPNLYIGITVGDKDELRPREQIAAVSLADTATSVQGLLPITNSDAGEKNVLLALDSAGNLAIGGNANPVFSATNGVFTLSGQSLLLTTNPGSNGNVVVNPDNLGKIDLQKPIQNTSEDVSSGLVPGAVNVEDSLAVTATDSSHSALYINQNDTGDIISANSQGTAKFSLSADGTAFFAGKIGLGTRIPNASLDVTGGTITADRLGLGTLPDAVYALTTNGNVRAGQFIGDQLKTTVTENTGLVKLLINAPANQQADLTQWQVDGKPLARLTAQGNLGIGDDTPLERLSVNGNAAIKGNILLLNGTHSITTASGDSLVLGDAQMNNLLVTPAGKIGLGTNNPNAKVQVSGGGLCVGSDTQCRPFDNAEGIIYASQTMNANYDVAEDYPTRDQSITPGDIVVLDENTGVFVKKSTGIGRENALGVISPRPGVHLGGFNGDQFRNERQVAVGLSGRIPVKVSMEGGAIHIGDPLTVSTIPGVAKKATHPGPIIGTALEDFNNSDPNATSSIMFFINRTWYDTDVYITDSGDVHGVKTAIQPNDSNELNDTQTSISTEPITHFFTNLTADTAQVTNIVTTDIYINSIRLADYITQTIANAPQLVAKKIVSPLASVNEIHTNIISPLSDDSSIALKFSKDSINIVNTNASASAVASFDASGNATFAGTLTSNQVTTNDASISGTLHAGRIIAEEIDGLPSASSGAQYITNVTNVYQTASSSATTDPSSLLTTQLGANVMNVASLSGVIAYMPNLQTDFATITKGLMSFGPTSLSDTSIAGQLSVNGNLIVSDSSINVLGSDLALQPLRQGGLSIMGGLVSIDTDGNLRVNGEAYFAQDVQIKGALHTNIISPVPDSDLAIHLGSNETQQSPNLVVKNASNSAVLTVSSRGDLTASGSGSFKDILTESLRVVRAVSADTSLTETVATASAGVATILPGQVERTIITPFVKADSLIYLTPASDTNGIEPYLSRQVAHDPTSQTTGSFTIGIPNVSTQPIKVNWWIVN